MNLTFQGNPFTGANGTVWKARDNDLPRDVAVKFFHTALTGDITRAKQHADTLSQINHPNVVRIYAIEQQARPDAAEPASGPEHALIMEWVEGIPFGEWLAKAGKSADEVAGVLRDLLNGLAAFHEKHLAHGDLHPKNIYVTNDGRAKLLDPIESDPIGHSQTSMINRDRRRRDISEARHLITQALIDFAGNTLAIGELNIIATATETVGELKNRLEGALAATLNQRTTVGVKAHSLLARMSEREIQSEFNGVVRTLPQQLATWMTDQPAPPENWDDARIRIYELINRIESYTAVGACVAEHGGPKSVASRLLREVTSLNLPNTSYGFFNNVQNTIVFAFHYFFGAIAILNGHLETAITLALTRMRPSRLDAVVSVYLEPEFIGWPKALGGNVQQSLTFLTDAFSSISILRDSVPSERQYLSGIAGYSLLLSLIECADHTTEQIDHFAALTSRERRFAVPAFFATMKDEAILDAQSFLANDGQTLRRLLKESGRSTESINPETLEKWVEMSFVYMERTGYRLSMAHYFKGKWL